MTRLLRQIAALVAKDLRIEARGRQTAGLIVVLGLLIVAVLSLGLGRQASSGSAAPAALWVAYLFSGVICFEKTMAVERRDGALGGLLMAPVSRGVLYAAKLAANLLLMLAAAAVVTPAAVVFFGLDLSADPLGFAAVVLLGMIGFAAVGTLFAAAASSTRLAGGLLAVLVFPVALPVVIASTHLLTAMYRDGTPPGGPGLAVLVAFDAIFLAASWLVFELVLEP